MTTRLTMTSKGIGAYEVTLDGQDVSYAVRAITLRAEPNELASVEVEIAAAVIERVDVPAKLWVAEESRNLLTRFGWTPPAVELDTQEIQ